MTKTLGMQFIQYMNLFERCIGLRSRHCFSYNGTIIFVVKPRFLAKAIGKNGMNIKTLSARFRKKVKIIGSPDGIEDIEKFVASIVYPVRFKKISLEGEDATINAPPQARAVLIGRNKYRLEELQNILEEYFGIKRLKIV
jgi:NusA-like KH domain protein